MLAGRVPVFHTAVVERAFLGRELRRRRLRLPAEADTEALGRLWLRERDGVAPAGLLAGAAGALLGQPAETPHHALGDALTTAKAFIALATHLDAVSRRRSARCGARPTSYGAAAALTGSRRLTGAGSPAARSGAAALGGCAIPARRTHLRTAAGSARAPSR